VKRLALFLALLASSVVAADDDTTVPVRFHGHWALTVEQCAPDPLDDANVRVSAKLVEDWQTRFEVSSVWSESGDMLILSGRVIVEGDVANAYENAKRLELFEEGPENETSLAVGEGEDRAVYVRCPT
jgi:hypothetical protein